MEQGEANADRLSKDRSEKRTSMATYVIGDVQGCLTSLRALLDQLAFDQDRDRLWFVGDLVNRGPDSLGVLRFIKALGPRAVTVLGNHDLHLLAVWTGATAIRQSDTFAEVLSAPDGQELLEWLRHRPLVHREGDYLLLHAGLLPQWTVSQAVDLAHEVEDVLRSDSLPARLPSIYYRPRMIVWKAGLSDQERLGLTTNVLTRLRVCSPDGVPEFSFKGPISKIPAGYMPWFRVPGRNSEHETILFGHWSALGVMIQERLIALDGGCVWGGDLVAIRLEDRRLFRVPCRTGRSPS